MYFKQIAYKKHLLTYQLTGGKSNRNGMPIIVWVCRLRDTRSNESFKSKYTQSKIEAMEDALQNLLPKLPKE